MTKINGKDLAKILIKVRPGLAQKDIIQQATHFVFTGDMILTYNDRICVWHKLETDFSCSVSSKEFYNFVSRVGDKEIELTLEDKNLVAKCGKIKGKFVSLSLDEYGGVGKVFKENLKFVLDEDLDWRPLPSEFLEALGLCSFSVSRDVRSVLNYICVSGQHVIASDDSRIGIYSLPEDIGCDFLIRANCAEELAKFDVDEFYLSSEWVLFRGENKDVHFCSRVEIDEFPSYLDLFDFKGVNLRLPGDLLETIGLASVVLDDSAVVSDDMVLFKIATDKLVVSSKKKDVGEITVESSVKFTSEPIEFSISPLFLKSLLENCDVRTMKYGDRKGLFISGKFKYLVCL